MTRTSIRERVIIGCLTVAAANGCMVLQATGQERGSGVAASESRNVGEFRRIEVRGSTDVVVTVGRAKAVVVSGDDNLISRVTTELTGETLVIGWKRGNHSPRTKMVVTISTPALDAVAILGSAGVTVDGLNAARFRAHIAGSGDLRVVGRTGDLDASVSGSGDMRLYELVAQKAQVHIAGSGDVQVTAQRELQATVEGSGDVRYRGEARTAISVSGSGSVRRG